MLLLLLLRVHPSHGLQQTSTGVLYPEFGLMLKDQGSVLASSDSIYMSLAIQLPSAQDLPNMKLEDVSCGEFSLKFRDALAAAPLEAIGNILSRQEVNPAMLQYYVNMCTKTKEISMQSQIRMDEIVAKIYQRYLDLDSVLAHTQPIDIKAPTSKRKRFIGGLVSVISSLIGGATNFLQERRMDALSSSIMATQTRLLQHEHNYADFKRSSYTSFMKLQDNQNTLAKNFDKYRKEGQNAIKLVNRNMEMFQLEHRLMVETLTFVVDALSNITISYTYKLNAAITQLNEYHTALSRFVDGMSDLTQGKLSTSLVPPYKLEAALNNVTRSAKERKAHMDVIDVAVSSYYNRKDTVFVVHNGTLYIQLEVFTKYKEAEIYTLYEIVTIPMPFDMTDMKPLGP